MSNVFTENAVIFMVMFAFINFILYYLLFFKGRIGNNVSGLIAGIMVSLLGAMMEWILVAVLLNKHLDKVLMLLLIIIGVIFIAMFIRMIVILVNKDRDFDKSAYIYDIVAMMFCVMIILVGFTYGKNIPSFGSLNDVAEAPGIIDNNTTVEGGDTNESDTTVEGGVTDESNTTVEGGGTDESNATVEDDGTTGKFVSSGYADDLKTDLDDINVDLENGEVPKEELPEETLEETLEEELPEETLEEASEEVSEEDIAEEASENADATVKPNNANKTDNVYILPNSNTKYISEADLEGFTAEQCMIARNELYARYGRIFTNETLKNHFEKQQWYEGKYAPENFNEGVLTAIEKANRDVILAYEKKMGYR